MSRLNLDHLLADALAHHQAGRLADAEKLYRRILQSQPDHADATHLLGMAAYAAGHVEESLRLIHRALALDPHHAEALGNLGYILTNLGRTDEARAALEHALSLRPDYPEALNNLANILKDTGSLDGAIALYERAIALRPDYAEAHNNLANLRKDQGRLDAAIAGYQAAMTHRPDYAQAHSNLIYALHYHPASTPQSILAECRRWNDRHAAPHQLTRRPHPNDRSPNRRLRIGYVSSDFRAHPCGYVIGGVLNHHDPHSFDSFLYSSTAAPDAQTKILAARAGHFFPVAGQTDDALAQHIRADRIDILIDLNLHTAGHRLLTFARKPAPIQITWLGLPSTTGLATMDYRLSDPYIDPAEADLSAYSETTVRLPHTFWCLPPRSNLPPAGPPPSQARGHVRFGSFNQFSKVSPAALYAWAEILMAVRGSELMLYSLPGRHRQDIHDAFRARGVDPARILIVGRTSLPAYLQRFAECDIALDTFPAAGGATTLDALSMGVPVVTLEGHTAAGRGGVSILSNINHPELIATTPQDYIRIATELATDPARLARLRSALPRDLAASPIADCATFTRDLESILRQVWHHWCTL